MIRSAVPTILTLIAFAVLASPALALEPQFYPNAKYNNSSVSQLQRDISACKAQGSNYAAGNQQSVLSQGVKTAAKGAALGAVAGSITGKAGKGAGAGAAVGGIYGTAQGVKNSGSGNPEFQKYTTVCLEEKGYKVVGWR